MPRTSGRAAAMLRETILEAGANRYAEGSCLVQSGNTRVLCTATIESAVPYFLKNTGKGWVTAEYGMLPRATHTRNPREASKGKLSGRTQEIQRLIGRSLRSVMNLSALGERQIIIDCDVLEADGGTRCASITGGYVALSQACALLMKQGLIPRSPIADSVAAISCGLIGEDAVMDLDYAEDSTAAVDANFIITGGGRLVEIQATGEGRTFTGEEFNALLELARMGTAQLADLQKRALHTL